MKRSRFTEEQISGILREQKAGVSIADVCWKRGSCSGLAAPRGGSQRSSDRAGDEQRRFGYRRPHVLLRAERRG